MGNIILVLLLLFNFYTWTPVEVPSQAGGETMEGLDRYMELMERREERGPVSAEEQIRVLGELGITLSDSTIASMGTFGEESFGTEYWVPLMMEGWGTYDYETYTWTPSSNQIYSFDAEVPDIDNMYQIYLQGLQSISEGELVFSDIAVDDSRADYEDRGGVIEVRFCLNGEAFQYEARYMGDWLDVQIRSEINRCLERQGIEKRFYATAAGQGEIIFFCTAEWAHTFEEATLCCMTNTTF